MRACNHLYNIQRKRLSHKTTDQGALCRFFSCTFEGRIKKWFDSFMSKSSHSWNKSMELFLISHHNYDYNQLCDEIESL